MTKKKVFHYNIEMLGYYFKEYLSTEISDVLSRSLWQGCKICHFSRILFAADRKTYFPVIVSDNCQCEQELLSSPLARRAMLAALTLSWSMSLVSVLMFSLQNSTRALATSSSSSCDTCVLKNGTNRNWSVNSTLNPVWIGRPNFNCVKFYTDSYFKQICNSQD